MIWNSCGYRQSNGYLPDECQQCIELGKSQRDLVDRKFSAKEVVICKTNGSAHAPPITSVALRNHLNVKIPPFLRHHFRVNPL